MSDQEHAAEDTRTCTCHPTDRPPVPCPRQFALSHCRRAAINRLHRPIWADVMAGCVHTPDHDQDLIPVTRETLRLALSAIDASQHRDAYHNFSAARQEIAEAMKAGGFI